tara:strand:+ start:1432 stop:2487 length:1056 start_codon:yes stop_codon:yes gene_type:complete
MAYTTIDNGEEHFNTVLYTGDGSADNDITGVGFAPDWVWAKNRGAADAHWVLDSTRGATKGLYTNGSAAENTQNHLISFDSDGFSVGNQANGLNTSSNNYVAWNWKANGGTTSSNSDGNITSTVQANTTSGFSIVTFTGNGNNDATIGHGLGTTPAMIITKNRDDAVLWRVWHQNLTSTNVLFLNENFAQTAPSGHSNGYIKTVGSSTYSVYQGNSDTNGVNGSSDDMLAYCFAEKQGYSKFGTYEANNSTDGPFVYTGFQPSFLILKAIDQTGNWFIFDNKRDTDNAVSQILYPDSSAAEGSAAVLDFVSNGVKIRNSGSGGINHSGTYIYMAFAEHPFVSSKGVPTTAR